MKHMITQNIKAGINVVFFDPKGDNDVISAVVQAAVESGRLKDMMLIKQLERHGDKDQLGAVIPATAKKERKKSKVCQIF